MIVTIVPHEMEPVTIVLWSIVTKVPCARETETIRAASLLRTSYSARARKGQW